MNRYPGRRQKAPRPTAPVTADWVFGLHPVRTLLARCPQRVQRVLLAQERDDRRVQELRAGAEAAGVRLDAASAEDIDAHAAGQAHQGVAALVTPAVPLDETAFRRLVEGLDHAPLLLVLDGVEDPRNLGACLRSADGAGVDAVVIPARRAAPLTASAVKTASGAAAAVPLAQVVNLARVLRWLRGQGIWIVGTGEAADAPLYRADLTVPLALVLGGEGRGMRRLTRELCDQIVSLPMRGVVESLNVSVAAGVCLYEALRQRGD